MDKLTRKQRKFAEEYLVDCNGTKAAIRAGYSPKTANEQAAKLMSNPKIKSYITEKLDEMSSEKLADAQEVLEYLTSVMRGEHTEQTLQLVGDGVQTITDIDVSAKERLKAAELIGKRYGLFKETYEIESVAPIVIVNDLNE
uniref:Terminase small subunit n=1 Tax=Myoviridae sp. ctdWz11 TaxID=2826671 RepID=A0A8S5NNY9_9CAUD|nr:MAG TPA: Terminase small subunit [Myoviridae sp. ctdWz11]